MSSLSILLALFLGTFGAHHFYLRRTGLGILYLCFLWRGIPAIMGFIECFFMPGRACASSMRFQAAGIAAALAEFRCLPLGSPSAPLHQPLRQSQWLRTSAPGADSSIRMQPAFVPAAAALFNLGLEIRPGRKSAAKAKSTCWPGLNAWFR